MIEDGRSSSYRNWLGYLEVAISLLHLTAIAVIALSVSATLEELAASLSFLIPGLLGLMALVSSVFDVYLIRSQNANPRKNISWWLLLGRLVVTGVIGLLAVATLFLILQTILIVTVINTGGGVIFGPILWTFTGTSLAVMVLLRSAVGIFFINDTSPFREKSHQ